MIIDLSELDQKSFRCIDGCAMCCLCQPELGEEELEIFQTDEYLRKGLTKEHIDGRRSAKPTAIKLQGKWGACYFLKKRKCTVNEIKPRFCRQFPIHIHVMRRLQLNVNLSCRGIGDGGDNLKSSARTLLSSIPEELLARELTNARKIVREFERRCQKAGVYQSPERIKSVAKQLMPLLAEEDGIGKLMAFADKEPMIGDQPAEKVVAQVEATAPAEDLDRIAKESNYNEFELEELVRLPVYVDENLIWNLFQSREGRIYCMVLQEDGEVELRKSLGIDEINILPRDEMALRVFANYAEVLIYRDPFMGNVAYVCNMHEYRHDLMTVYLGVLGTKLLDLWWRASLLGKIYERDEIDQWLAMEGVKAFDMDCLDAPTIGSFI